MEQEGSLEVILSKPSEVPSWGRTKGATGRSGKEAVLPCLEEKMKKERFWYLHF